jgi:hypothetical protein
MSSVATIGSVNVEVRKYPKPPPLEPSVGVRAHYPLHLLPRSCRLPPLSCHTSSKSPAKVQCSDQLRHRIAAVDEASLLSLKAYRALLHGHLCSPLNLIPLLPLDLHPSVWAYSSSYTRLPVLLLRPVPNHEAHAFPRPAHSR